MISKLTIFFGIFHDFFELFSTQNTPKILKQVINLQQFIEEWNQKVIETFSETKFDSDEVPKYNSEALLRLIDAIDSIPSLANLVNGRLFVCFLAPFFLLLEDTSNKNVKNALDKLGNKMIKESKANGMTKSNVQGISMSLEDFEDLM